MLLTNKNFAKLKKLRKSKKTVMCHGVFDVLHYGHITHFEEAKKRGDLLIVSITDDKFVSKGPDRPIFNSIIRAKSLLSLKVVDFVIISKDFDCINTLKIIRPDYFAKDIEYLDKNHNSNITFEKEKKYLKKIKSKLIFTKQKNLSSSEIIKLKFNNDNNTQRYIKSINKKFNFSNIEKTINKIKNLEVCLIGDPIIDKYTFCQTEGISSKSPTLASIFKKKEKYLGGVLAISEMANSLGAKVNLITYGNKSNIQKNFNNKINYISINKSKKIPEIERIINTGRLEKLHQMYHFNNTSKKRFILPTFVKKLKPFIKKKIIILVIDFGFNFFEETFFKFMSKTKYSVNTHTNSINKNFNHISKYKNSKYFSINLNEYCLDRRLNIDGDLIKLKNYIIKKEKHLNFSITMGKRGSIFLKNGKIYDCPAFFKNVIDTTGCGDAYFIVTSILNSLNIEPELIPLIGNIYAGLHANIIGNKTFVSNDALLKNLKLLLN